MKTRNGFVSNSSSTSYVIILPDNFTISASHLPVKLLFDVLKENKYLNESCLPAIENLGQREVRDAFNSLQKILQNHIITDIGTDADQGTELVLLDNSEIRKLLKGQK